MSAPQPDTVPFELRVRGIRKSFSGTEVLHGVDLDITGGRVLALLGENGAGKSTLVRVLAGAHTPDAGTLEFRTSSDAVDLVHSLDPVAARRRGIRMIFQELSDAPDLTVAENVALGQWPTRHGLVRWARLRRQAREVLDGLGVHLDLDATVGSLRIGERQIVEIARALSESATCLVLDEPTAALSSDEVQRLFGFVRRLRERGVALVYITHRLDEVAAIADDVVVLRDGAVSASGPAGQFGRRDLVRAMVGRDIGAVTRPPTRAMSARAKSPAAATRRDEVAFGSGIAPEAKRVGRDRIRGRRDRDRASAGEPVLVFEAASSAGAFADVDLTVAAGEVVCLYGKVGSGTAEVADTVFGRRHLTAGYVQVLGGPPASQPRQAIDHGVGYLAADRQREGVLASRTVGENLAAPSWPRLARRGVVERRVERAAYARWRDVLDIQAAAGADAPITSLSGGNQQKVLLARWLEHDSSLLALVEPTRGVDVGARADIYRVLRELAAKGTAVVVATSDYEEVVQLADRAVVMARGTVVAQLSGDEITTEALTDAAGG